MNITPGPILPLNVEQMMREEAACAHPLVVRSPQETASALQSAWQSVLRQAKEEGRGKPAFTTSSPVASLFPPGHRLVYDWILEIHDERLMRHEHPDHNPKRESTWSFLIMHPAWAENEGVFFFPDYGGDFVYTTYKNPKYRGGYTCNPAWVLDDIRRVARRHFR